MADNHHLRIDLFLLITLLLLTYSSSFALISSQMNSNEQDVSFPLNLDWIDMPETSIYRSVHPWRNRLLKSIRIQSISPENLSNEKRYASQAFHAMRG
jgi:hypothetical protein